MKQILFSLLFLFSITANAQVGIGTATPNSSAQLDLQSTTKGFLVPRMTQLQVSQIVTPATGLLVYQTDGTAGFYYFDGAVWKSGVGNGSICGSANTNYVAKFTGPNTMCNSIISDDGTNVGISKPAPAQKLDVAGNVQFSGALMPGGWSGVNGLVLTSSGASAAPVWNSPTNSLYNNINVAYGTATITTTTTWQIIPGMTQTITVPPGRTAKVIVHADVGILTNCATNGGISGTDVAIYRNAALPQNAGFKRTYLGDALIDLDENNVFGNPSMQVIETLTEGTYTYDLRCWQQLTGSCNAAVGGGPGDLRQGILSVILVLN